MPSPDYDCRCWSGVRQAATAVSKSERRRGETYTQHQGVLLGAHDLLRRRVVADSHSKLRRSLSTHKPRTWPLFRSSLLTDRKSTRLNSSHLGISYAVFCLKKK